MKNTIFTLLTLVLFTACSKDDEAIDYSQQNEAEIQAYLEANNLDAERSNSGLYYIIDEVGTGQKPISTDRVKVKYEGYLTTGEVFEEWDEDGFSFFLYQVISGWQEGLTYFNEGGSGKLIIPAHLAYGSYNNGIIKAGSVLIFDIELIYVNYETENEEQIQAYLTENELTAQPTGTGLYYNIHTPGEGTTKPTTTDNVSVTYKGQLLNGTVFDQSTTPVSFNLSGVIPGFSEGLTFFNEGDAGTLYIPAHLAYGNQQLSSIPIGSVLIFEVNLISVN
ncbi:FKBP-type peptidyl-prolyl cis-trans isomerase [Mariniflexile sp.]|uniref:FKBP-type peptidyl-prolyl cis-trans isomerase n=1 Tax=Mariniflexile sp. TaxID=1979402 RepID=UPI003567B304